MAVGANRYPDPGLLCLRDWALEADDLRWFVEQWLSHPARCDDPQVSSRHTDLTGLPPTLLATAEHDPLRDEGDALAQQMRDPAVRCSMYLTAGWSANRQHRRARHLIRAVLITGDEVGVSLRRFRATSPG